MPTSTCFTRRIAPLRLRRVPGRMLAAVATLAFGGAMGSRARRCTSARRSGRSSSAGSGGSRGALRLRILLVAGAAAGVAAIFKAPATGAIFCSKCRTRTIWRGACCCRPSFVGERLPVCSPGDQRHHSAPARARERAVFVRRPRRRDPRSASPPGSVLAGSPGSYSVLKDLSVRGGAAAARLEPGSPSPRSSASPRPSPGNRSRSVSATAPYSGRSRPTRGSGSWSRSSCSAAWRRRRRSRRRCRGSALSLSSLPARRSDVP